MSLPVTHYKWMQRVIVLFGLSRKNLLRIINTLLYFIQYSTQHSPKIWLSFSFKTFFFLPLQMLPLLLVQILLLLITCFCLEMLSIYLPRGPWVPLSPLGPVHPMKPLDPGNPSLPSCPALPFRPGAPVAKMSTKSSI